MSLAGGRREEAWRTLYGATKSWLFATRQGCREDPRKSLGRDAEVSWLHGRLQIPFEWGH